MTTDTRLESTRRQAMVAAAGPVVIGVILGSQANVFALVHDVIALPLIVAGVAAFTVPALYIGLHVVSDRDVAKRTPAALRDALRATGMCLLGLAPPMLFLLHSAPASRSFTFGLGFSALALAAIFGLRRAHSTLFSQRDADWPASCVFYAWAALGLIMGSQYFSRHIAI